MINSPEQEEINQLQYQLDYNLRKNNELVAELKRIRLGRAYRLAVLIRNGDCLFAYRWT